MISFQCCFDISQWSSCVLCVCVRPSLRSPWDLIWAPLGRKRSLCDTKILACAIFSLWKPCLTGTVFHPRSQPSLFPWDVRGRVFGLIRGNLQMFVNTCEAAETREDLACKHSDVEYLSELGFLGKLWSLGSLTEHIKHAASSMSSSMRVGFFYAYTHHLHCQAASHREPTVNQWMLLVDYNHTEGPHIFWYLQPLHLLIAE